LGELIRFRLFDDDGEPLYEGRLHDDELPEPQALYRYFIRAP
jgi:hypothetical protein